MMPGVTVLPDLSTLPFWAQFLIYTIFGVSVSVVVILTFLGFKIGQKGTPPAADQARVAAVIVEPTALNHATSAVNSMAGELRELTTEVRELTRAVNSMILEMARKR